MRSALTLVLAFLVSTFVGGIVATQLAVAFDTGQEFIAIIMLFVVSAIVAAVAFGLSLAFSKSARPIDWTALALLAVVALMIVGFALMGAGGQAVTVSRQDLPLLAEIVVPTALMIGIQWWLVRRRWRRAHATTGMT